MEKKVRFVGLTFRKVSIEQIRYGHKITLLIEKYLLLVCVKLYGHKDKDTRWLRP